MGTQVVVNALHHVSDPVDHVALLASNIDVDKLVPWGYKAVDTGAGGLDSYYNPSDPVLSDWATDNEVGEEGLPDSTPSNIEDHNVNDITGSDDSGHGYHHYLF